jgi:dTDP-4-amino-4,6-dideoxygalactose transaminase
VTANDPELAERMKILRVHGSKQKYYHHWVGANFRIDALQAAILRVKLRSLDQWSVKRQQNAARYRELFAEHDLTNTLTLPQVVGNKRHIFNQFVVRAPKRDELIQHLKTKQVGCEIYYPLSLHEQECFAYLGYRHGDFPISEAAASSVLALPIFPELSDDELRYVVSSISEFYHR